MVWQRGKAVIALHAIWENLAPGRLHIWAETSSPPATAAPRSGGTKKYLKEQRKQQHPFVLTHQALMAAIKEHLGILPLESAETGALTLRLPSTTKGPQHSPELIVEREDEEQGPTEFKAWEVAALTLNPKLALDFLLRLHGELQHGVAFGSSLRFWAEAANFAFELMTRQSYTPALQEFQRDNATHYRAAWEAVLAGEDDERIYLLSTMMPPLCWAYLPPGERVSSLPQNLLTHFLNATIDALVRESLSPKALLPPQRSNRR